MHDQWASGAGGQIGHWQGKCFKERLAREKAEWGLQARMAFERGDRHKETQRALAQPTVVPRTAYKVARSAIVVVQHRQLEARKCLLQQKH